jgi:outer membrane protein OmpA-like peptidoglycan-associated protein
MGAEACRRLIGLLLMLLAASLTSAAWAQPAPVPATGEMIEALKPGLSRSARNLVVRQRVEESATPATPAAPAASEAAAAPALAPTNAPTNAPTHAPTHAASISPASDALPSLSLAIQFELNSARVRPESGPLLGNLVAALQSPELKSNRFLIEGHTDASGSAGANQKLSQERAEEVRLYLVALGVHPSRLRAVGKGASELADPLNPLAGANRRVRVVTQP